MSYGGQIATPAGTHFSFWPLKINMKKMMIKEGAGEDGESMRRRSDPSFFSSVYIRFISQSQGALIVEIPAREAAHGSGV